MHGFLRVGRKADGNERIAFVDGAQLHLAHAAHAFEQVHRGAEQPVHIDQRESHRKAGAHAHDMHVARFLQQFGGGGQAGGAVLLGLVEVAALHGKHLGGELFVAGAAQQAACFVAVLQAGFAGQAHVGGERLLELVPACEFAGLRKAHQGGGRHLRVLAHGAHRLRDHVVGVVEHIAGHLLQRGAEGGETLAQLVNHAHGVLAFFGFGSREITGSDCRLWNI